MRMLWIGDGMTKEQFDVMSKASRTDDVEKSIYIYYSVLYESFFGKTYITSYFYEIIPMPRSREYDKESDFDKTLFNLNFAVIWSESKELKQVNALKAKQ